ncbi:MAG: hypothetical protein RL007_415 [Bacteroidota bacterium]
MRMRIGYVIVVTFLTWLVAFPLCTNTRKIDSEDYVIRLCWYKSLPDQKPEHVYRGMIWCFSWLGAELPKGCMKEAIVSSDSMHLEVHLDKLGFNKDALQALKVVTDSIRNSEEYRTQGELELGKFIALTLGTSEHYYRITGVPRTIDEFRKLHGIDQTAWNFGVTKSSISDGHRLVKFSRDTSLFKVGFIAEESSDSITGENFHAELFECFDIMPNGQLRFAIYDESGNLLSGAPRSLTEGGKPAKCLWCHETSIQTLFIDNIPVAGMLSNEEFLSMRDEMQDRLVRYRATLNTEMNFSNHPEHTLGELIYIFYMEPTLLYVQNSWQFSESQTLQRLGNLHAEPFREFTWIGKVYHRFKIDSVSGKSVLEIPFDVRETGREVNYFKGK